MKKYTSKERLAINIISSLIFIGFIYFLITPIFSPLFAENLGVSTEAVESAFHRAIAISTGITLVFVILLYAIKHYMNKENRSKRGEGKR